MNGTINSNLVGSALVGLAVLAALPAAAQSTGWYVAGSGTYTSLEDSRQTVENAPAPGQTLRLTNSIKSGWGGSAAVGRNFGSFRLEGEIGYSENDSDSYTVSSPFQATIAQDGRTDVTRYMGNVYWDFLSDDAVVRPFFGAGLGFAQADIVRIATIASNPTAPPSRLIDDKVDGAAWQVMAGASWRLNDRISLTAQYRWFDLGEVEGQDARGQTFRSEIAGHHLDVGVRLRF